MEHASQREFISEIERLEERIERYPMAALGIAALAGFVLGGGLKSKAGLTLIAFAGRMVLRETTLGLVRNTLSGDGRRQQAHAAAADAPAAAFD